MGQTVIWVRSRSWAAKSGGKISCNKFISKFSWEQHLWDRKGNHWAEWGLDCCCSHDKGSSPGGLWQLEWASRVGSRVPGLYTSAYPVTGYSLVPDTSKDFNLKKNKKLLLNQEQFLESWQLRAVCRQHTAWGKTLLSAFWKRNWGGSRRHMGTSSGLKAYGLFSHCHVLNHFWTWAKLREKQIYVKPEKTSCLIHQVITHTILALAKSLSRGGGSGCSSPENTASLETAFLTLQHKAQLRISLRKMGVNLLTRLAVILNPKQF